jgi:hypothetical protein
MIESGSLTDAYSAGHPPRDAFLCSRARRAVGMLRCAVESAIAQDFHPLSSRACHAFFDQSSP